MTGANIDSDVALAVVELAEDLAGLLVDVLEAVLLRHERLEPGERDACDAQRIQLRASGNSAAAAAAAYCSRRRTCSRVAVVVISVVLRRLRAGGLQQRAGVLAEEHLRLHLRACAAREFEARCQ